VAKFIKLYIENSQTGVMIVNVEHVIKYVPETGAIGIAGVGDGVVEEHWRETVARELLETSVKVIEGVPLIENLEYAGDLPFVAHNVFGECSCEVCKANRALSEENKE